MTSFEHDGSAGAKIVRNSVFVAPTGGASISIKITALPRNMSSPIHTETVTINAAGTISPDAKNPVLQPPVETVYGEEEYFVAVP